MNDRESLARDLVLAVASSHITESEPSWETVADRLLSYGWGRLPQAPRVVVDPADPAVIDRVAEVHRVHANLRGGRVMHCRCGEASPDQYGAIRWHSGHVARAVLAALGADQPEPPVSLSVQRRLDVMRGDRDE